MKPVRIRYNTMNSWNGQTAPAYNLKVHKVIPHSLQSKVFELMDCENFYDEINFLRDDFAEDHEFKWQAGFNGRSDGYLVLYRGEKKLSPSKSICNDCGQRNFKTIEETGTQCGRCGNPSRVNRTMYDISISCGGIEDNEVPKEVMQSFTRLANNIVNSTIQKAKKCNVKEETYIVTKTRKVMA
jgi:DNA-directed RNA polymerase subunit M/transcription elongation factor TFIIS